MKDLEELRKIIEQRRDVAEQQSIFWRNKIVEAEKWTGISEAIARDLTVILDLFDAPEKGGEA